MRIDIVITVGGNPLPIYILLNYLVDHHIAVLSNANDAIRVVMIESKETKKTGQRIVNLLDSRLKNNNLITLREVVVENISVPGELMNKLYPVFSSDDMPNALYFCYTGGTKSMIMDTLFVLLSHSNIKCSIMLVDIIPTTHKIVIKKLKHDNNELAFEAINYFPEDKGTCLYDVISLKLEDIIKLHGLELINYNNSFFIDEYLPLNIFKEGIPGPLLSQLKKWKRELDKNRPIDMVINSVSSPSLEFFYQFLTDLGLSKEVHLLRQELSAKKSRHWKKILDYLDGFWLEEYVYSLLKEKLKGKNNFQIFKNVEVKYKERRAELDIVIVKGYELFVLSISTTKQLQLLKLKLFEVLYRSEQIGGMQAKMILISLAEEWKIKQLKKDLSNFNIQGRVKIWGYNELIMALEEELSDNNNSIIDKLFAI